MQSGIRLEVTGERPVVTPPQPPKPDANYLEVRQFLSDFFLYCKFDMTIDQVQVETKKFDDNGAILYITTKEEWTALYGRKGKLLYNIIQSSPYAPVSLKNCSKYHLMSYLLI